MENRSLEHRPNIRYRRPEMVNRSSECSPNIRDRAVEMENRSWGAEAVSRRPDSGNGKLELGAEAEARYVPRVPRYQLSQNGNGKSDTFPTVGTTSRYGYNCVVLGISKSKYYLIRCSRLLGLSRGLFFLYISLENYGPRK